MVQMSVAEHDNTQFYLDAGKIDQPPTEKGCYGDELCFSHFHAINAELNNAKSFFEAQLLPNTPYRINLISQTSPPEIKPPIHFL